MYRFTMFLMFFFLLLSNLYAFEVNRKVLNFKTKVLSVEINVKAVKYSPDTNMNKPLLVMLHGTTYGKWMWDVPGASWKEYLTGKLGYSMICIDLPGHGESSKPNGDFLSPVTTASAIRQVIKKIKMFLGKKIVLIGHSYGGLIANLVAGSENRIVDGIAVLGWGHYTMAYTEQDLYVMSLPDSYMAYPTESRLAMMYYAPGAEQSVMDYDTEKANPFVRGGITSKFQIDKVLMEKIKAPVFISSGEHDVMLGDYSLESEIPLYPNSKSVTTYLQPESGHVSVLHRNYEELINKIDIWISSNI